MKTYNLYNGQIQIQFDPDDHVYYDLNNNKIDNMTSIVGILSNKSAMANWASKMCQNRFNELIFAGRIYDEIELIDIAKEIQKAPNQNRDKAGNIGTKVHDLIEQYIHCPFEPEIQNKEIKNAFDEFVNWFKIESIDLELTSTEKKVYSKKYNFTGTTDALFKNKKTNEYIIYDWKTSSGIYHSHLLQVTGYAMALEEEFNIEIKKGVIGNFPKKGKKKLCAFDIDASMRDSFLACLNLYRLTERKIQCLEK